MTTPALSRGRVLVCTLACALLSACSDKAANATTSSVDAEDAPRKSASSSTSAAASATSSAVASAAPVAPPTPVDLARQTWSEGGETLPLTTTDLSKRCLLKGVTMVLPEKVAITPLMGSRGCVVRPWGEKGPYIFVVNDELNFSLPPKSEIKGIKRVIEETADSWLIEDEDAKNGFAGRVTRKLGDHTVWCNVNANGKANGEVIARGLVSLCSTIAYTAPAKK